jgi:hypothetical protein
VESVESVLFSRAGALHQLRERLPKATTCGVSVPAGVVTKPQRDAMLSAEVFKIKLCGTCYPNRQALVRAMGNSQQAGMDR